MRLLVTLPARIAVDRKVDRVLAEGVNGSFGLLPRHVDMVTELVPGLLAFTGGDTEEYLAIDGGVLAKVGDTVMVATTAAVGSTDLGDLRRVVAESYRKVEEGEQSARAALARLESEIVHGMVELEERRGG